MKRTRIALALPLAACLGGCHVIVNVDHLTCASLCATEPDPDACIADCGTCKGQCVARTPEGFDGPALLWVGRTVDEPQCPDSAPVTVYKGYHDLDDPIVCSPCLCSEPTCALPEGLRMAASARCEGAGIPMHGMQDVLNGDCVVPDQALANDDKALLLGSPRFMPCTPSVEPPPVPLISFSRWYRSGKACAGVTREDACSSPSKTCVPAERMEDFSHCIMHVGEGEAICPQEYPVQVVLYDDVRDERYCTPCECGPPTGGKCSLTLVSYRDGECSDMLVAGAASSKEPGCLAPTPGVQPNSMKAIWKVDTPGRCEPRGGELTGEAIPTGPSTFCCKTRPARMDD